MQTILAPRSSRKSPRGSDPLLPPAKGHALCRGCNRYFWNLAAYDAHRVGPLTDRACAHDAQMRDAGLELDGSYWRRPRRSFDLDRRRALNAVRRADRQLEAAA